MIERLFIQNLVLVEEATLLFSPQLNMITGETGAGKTAITEGIALCLGKKTSSDLIRKGAEKACIEMVLQLDDLSPVRALMEESGLEWESPLLIRREITKEGKSRAWINCQPASVSFLAKLSPFLVDSISQHSHQEIRSQEGIRSFLDLFSDAKPLLLSFQKSYRTCKERQCEIEQLTQALHDKEKQEEHLLFQLEELQSASLQPEEEDEIFTRYKNLASASERITSLHTALSLCQEGPSSLLSQFNKLLRITEPLSSFDPKLNEGVSLFQGALLSLKEGMFLLESSCQEDLADPKELASLEERLSLLQKLKRKHGKTIEELLLLQKDLEKRLLSFAELSSTLEEKIRLHAQEKAECDHAAQQLTLARKKGASLLSSLLTQEMSTLNMNKASLTIDLSPCSRTEMGDETILFWLQANPGEKKALVKEYASGGELCRLLFAIKLILAEKNEPTTLIFDEIDAHVGGKTASLIGQKLHTLARNKQVICITHFPQVAQYGDRHIEVVKVETKEGRTETKVTELASLEEKTRELARMSGA